MTMPHKVDQTIFQTDSQRNGNCFAACVASALGKRLADVPLTSITEMFTLRAVPTAGHDHHPSESA